MQIAWRNTRRQKKRSMLLAGAIAFGFMVITLLNGFTAGTVENLKNNFSSLFGGHIFVSGTELTDSGRPVNRIGDSEVVEESLAAVSTQVQELHKRSQAFGELIFGSRKALQQISGVDFQDEQQLIEGLKVVEGSLEGLDDEQSLLLPAPTARQLGVKPGETLLLRVSTVTGQQNVGEFRVIAVIESQASYGITAAYAHLRYLNLLLGLEPGEYQMMHMTLPDMADIDQVALALHRELAARAPVEPRRDASRLARRSGEADPEQGEPREEMQRLVFGSAAEPQKRWEGTKFTLTTLNDVMQPVQSIVQVLNTIALAVFIVLLLITMVGITNTFRIILIERTQEIGTMRAFGMQRGTVRSIFLCEAAFIGVIGAAGGLLAAGVIMFGLSLVPLDTIPVLQFFLDDGRLTFQIRLSTLSLHLALLLGMSLLAAYGPARAAAHLQPAKALRTRF